MVTLSLVGGLLALPPITACDRERLEVAPAVDLDRFQGKWHEIGHLPRPAQSDCKGTTATYTKAGDGKLTFVHECTLANGSYHGSTASAKVVDPAVPAKLEVDFGGYLGEYWILEVAPDYRYAVVGHPSREYLWILSRTPQMDPKDLDAALDRARQQSFDVSRLQYTPRGPAPQGTPAPERSFGCALGARSGRLEGSFLLAALGLLGSLGWRRRGRPKSR